MEVSFRRIGILGAGVIGSGVAQLFAETEHEVVLCDISEAQLERARLTIRRDIRLYSLIRSRAASLGSMDRVHCSTDPNSLRDCDFVIENITENAELKLESHANLDRIVGRAIPVAINTSAIPITRIASAHSRPERVVGMHFMNPPPLMPTVELIRGECTSPETIDAAQRLVTQAGRQAILVNDSPGFVTNRVMMLMVNEAIFLVSEGVAAVQDIDRLFKTCFGHKMGPLETADLIGLDTVLKSIEVIYEELNDSKYRPCALLKKMVYAGKTGRKAGRGFYEYQSLDATVPTSCRDIRRAARPGI